MNNEEITKIFFRAKQGDITLDDLNKIEQYIKTLEEALNKCI